MKILAIYDGSGPKYHRILLPMSLMPGIDLCVAHTITDENADCDILFFNRAISKTSLNQILEYKAQYGFKMICDLDDHWKLSPDHILFDHYRDSNLTELIEAYIKESDHITVTHDRLAEEAYQVNQNVTILPNAIPEFAQFTYPKTPNYKLRLFWAGSVTHDKDMELLRGPIKRMGDLPVRFVMGGYGAHPAFKRMASAYTNGSRWDNELLESLPVEQYYAAYSRCDIALIPLTVSTFNQYKSNLKILEAANIGAPVIVSKVHPYMDFPEHLVNYVEKASDWNRHVRRLINDREFLKWQGHELKSYCQTVFNFNSINQKRYKLFEQYAPSTRQIPGEVHDLEQ